MLENLRKQGASIVIYAIFGILIAVFVINFGAQSVGTSQGCRTSDAERVIAVDGHDVGMNDWRWVSNVLKGTQIPPQQRALYTFEWLVQRQILADEARRRGMYVNDDLIDQNLEKGRIYFYGGQDDQLVPYFIDDHGIFFYDLDELVRTKQIDAELAKKEPPGLVALARQFGLSIAAVKEQQREETLAAMMKTILAGEPRASVDEARASWLYSNASVDIQAIEFNPKTYADALLPTDAEVDAWAKAHEADVKAAFDRPTLVHIKQIYLPKAKAAPPPAPAGAGSGAGPVTLPPDAQLGVARSMIEGGKTFAEAAKMGAPDAKHPLDLGWRDSTDPGLGSTALDRAVGETAPQGLSKVVTLEDGYYLLQVDVADKPTFDKLDAGMKRDLARTLARAAWGDEAAKRAALAALDKSKTVKSLTDIYPPAATEPAPSPTGPVPPGTAPSIKVEPAPGTKPAPAPAPAKTGRIEIESPDVPAVWGADDQTPPAGGAAPAAPAATPAPAGSPAAAAGAAPAPAKPAAPPELKASTDPLPAMTTVTPHTVRYAEVTREGGELPFALTPELQTALFETMGEHQIATRVFQVGGSYVLVELVRKNLPDDKQFEKTATDDVARLAYARGEKHFETFLRDQCETLWKAGKIKDWNKQLLVRNDENGKQVQMPYQPCFTLGVHPPATTPAE
jgi:hypothetical protein